MDQREEILRLVIMKGPVLPSHINKDLKRDSLFTAAMLSEMVDSKKLKLTKLKIGGSPLYYAPGQENKLQFYAKHLHEKELRAYEKLRTEKILVDNQQDPVIRTALREIKDFAVPLEATINDNKQLVWKWYLLPNHEAEPLIKQKIVVTPPPQPAPQPSSFTPPAQQTALQETAPLQEDELKSEQKRLQETIDRLQQKIEEQQTQPTPPQVTAHPTQEVMPERQPVPMQEPATPPPEPKKVILEKKIEQTKKEAPKKEKITKEKQQKLQEEKEDAEQEPDREKEIKPIRGDVFYDKIKAHFDKNKIEILQQKVIRKNSELEFELLIPSSVGELSFFCKARNKKKCNDGDLSSAFLEGQRKKMPVLFLTTGELTKKAVTILTTDLRSITVQTLGD